MYLEPARRQRLFGAQSGSSFFRLVTSIAVIGVAVSPIFHAKLLVTFRHRLNTIKHLQNHIDHANSKRHSFGV